MNHLSLRNFILGLLGVIAPLLISSSYVLAAHINIAWDANTELDLAGYKVYYVTASEYYGGFRTPINVGNVTSYTITGLPQGQTYYIVVTAYENATPANESGYSNEVRGAATEPGPSLNDTVEFVKQVYRDFLNREAKTGGLQFWVNMIDSGAMPRAQVVDSLFWSEEFGLRIAPILRLYVAYFLRIPGYAELRYRIYQYINGQPLESISDAFAASQEFQQRYGSLSNEEFVMLVYQNVLGRSPDPEGFAYWVGQLNLGALTRGQLMLELSESPEYEGLTSIEVFVTMMYMGLLGRSPDQESFDYWVGYLDSGNSEYSMIDAFLNSQEYADRF
jgi:hypothetical protein